MLIHDLDVTIIERATGEILRELRIDPTRKRQPTRPDAHQAPQRS